ncbi:MAG: DUF1926 domain-containing protein [Helicobacteraceae bacterium]|jgi:hypothetical protein|nr:DUF1926 domain-containing protein [Helicobacteraceae bacterium]
MKKTSLLFGIHSHQPVDNFDHVVLDAIDKAYRPFFETLNYFPDFKFNAHFSGWLLEFIQKRDKKLFALMREMSARGQIEWFGGGYYEPILASIPSRDRKRQIAKLSDFIEANFAQRPKGLWLTERVWDASIVGDLAELGIEYAMIDDYHLITAGVLADKLNGYYVTENGGNKLALFPISKTLRYQIPFWDHHVVAKSIADLGGAAIIFDDGEKFGVWPGTNEWVYKKEWLTNFMQAVLRSEEIGVLRYRDFIAVNKPLGIAYPSDVSYMEMGEWSLNTFDAVQLEYVKKQLEQFNMQKLGDRYVRGATWKNFLVKYAESGRIHRRMLALSAINDQKNDLFNEALMKAQCNDVLWHGIFGGLYLPNLRDNAWRFLIEAEDMIAPKSTLVSDERGLDSFHQTRLYTKNFIAAFEQLGGMLTEFHLRKERFNILNTLTRRKEAYHNKIAPAADHNEQSRTIHEMTLSADQESLRHLVTDRSLRGGFVDHLTEANFDLTRFFEQSFDEHEILGNTIYLHTKSGGNPTLFNDRISKTIFLEEGAVAVETEIKNIEKTYVQEHNFHFANLADVQIGGQKANEDHVFEESSELVIVDSYLKKSVALRSDRAFKAFTHPLYTVSQSESGVELTCQGIAIALCFGVIGKARVTLSVRDSNERI